MENNNILRIFSDSRTFKKIVHRLDNIQLRGKQVSIYRVLENLIININNDDILHRASSVAFSFTLAVFPAIIFLFSLIPYIPIPNLQSNIQEFVSEVAMLEEVGNTIMYVVKQPRGDLLSFSVLFLLFLSTNGMMELAQTFNKIYRTIEKRSYWHTRLIALFLTVLLALVMFSSLILLTAGSLALNFMVDNGLLAQDFLYYSLLFLKFFVLFILILIVISSIYYFVPALHDRWPFISFGGVLATLSTILVSYLFSFYMVNFGTYNKIYGSIGTMMALMVWIYMISVILLIGFEVNASLNQVAHQKEENKE